MSYALQQLSWPEVGRILAREPRLIFPVGALEQHGPHLPLGANVVIASRVAEDVSERLGVLRAPPFYYGVAVGGGPFAGVAGLRRKTFHRAVNELLARWEDHGVTECIIVTAHRYEPHLEALLMALTATAVTTVFDLFRIDVADLVEGDPEREHGGELETSLLLHLAPESVRLAVAGDFVPEARTLRRYTQGRIPTPPPESGGVVGRPSRASREKGRAIFERYVDALATALSPNARPPQG